MFIKRCLFEDLVTNLQNPNVTTTSNFRSIKRFEIAARCTTAKVESPHNTPLHVHKRELYGTRSRDFKANIYIATLELRAEGT